MKKKLINIFTNETEVSLETNYELTKLLIDRGYTVTANIPMKQSSSYA